MENVSELVYSPLCGIRSRYVWRKARISYRVFRTKMLIDASVLDVYKRGGGKSGMHVWTSHTTTITAASNVVVQIFFAGTMIHHFLTATPFSLRPAFDVARYALLPSHHFLVLLQSPPQNRRTAYELEGIDAQHCRDLYLARARLGDVVKGMPVVSRGKKADNGMDGDGLEELA